MKFLKNILPLEKSLMLIKYPAAPSRAPTSGAWCMLSSVAWAPSPGGSRGNLLQLGHFSLIQFHAVKDDGVETLCPLDPALSIE